MAMTAMQTVNEFRDSTALLDVPAELRRRAAEDGYLFFRGLIPRADVFDLRRCITDAAAKHGWFKPGTDPMDAIVSGDVHPVEGSAEWKPFYADVMRQRTFHAFGMNPALLRVFAALFAAPTLPHARNICRAIFPGSAKITTPAHQDFIHIRGTENTWTAWVPVGDCPIELGGLAVCPRTHRDGVLPTRSTYGAGGVGVDIAEGAEWLTTDYRAGDVVMFHSLCVHQGQDNATADRVRISIDFRYQPADEAVHPSSMRPHHGFMNWDDIYPTWGTDENDPLKYFWKKLEPKYTPE